MKRPKRDPVREDRIHNEAIVDASPDEQAMSWYYYLESKICFPFQAKCLIAKDVSPLSAANQLLNCPDPSTLKGKRDRALLAVLLGCALRRSELACLTREHLQVRDGRWCIVDMKGKGGRIRTIPCPAWVMAAINMWTSAAGIADGILFRPINRGGRMWGEKFSEKVVWQALQKYAEACGQRGLAPHDLRRTCAKLCRDAGGELEQIQFLLGHSSITTTERYLGSKQDLSDAPNDHLGLKLQSV